VIFLGGGGGGWVFPVQTCCNNTVFILMSVRCTLPMLYHKLCGGRGKRITLQ
jgi:hypothetical protein